MHLRQDGRFCTKKYQFAFLAVLLLCEHPLLYPDVGIISSTQGFESMSQGKHSQLELWCNTNLCTESACIEEEKAKLSRLDSTQVKNRTIHFDELRLREHYLKKDRLYYWSQSLLLLGYHS